MIARQKLGRGRTFWVRGLVHNLLQGVIHLLGLGQELKVSLVCGRGRLHMSLIVSTVTVAEV